jgi:hypothetical protein
MDMITLIVAAALAAQTPAAPAHEPMMKMGEAREHKADCCKHCCKEMAGKHDGHGSGQAEHGSH